MNRIQTLAAIALSFAAAGTAFADDITIDTAQHLSLKSRADVQQELAIYKQQRINPWSSSYSPWNEVPAVRTRVAMRAEVQAARSTGEAGALLGEDSGSVYLAQAHRPAKLNNMPVTASAGLR